MPQEILRTFKTCLNYVYHAASEAFVSKSNLAMGFSSLCLGQICFNQNMKCDSRCRCKDCGNQPTMEDDMKENPFRIKIKVQPTAQYMVPPKVKNNEAMSPVPIIAVSSDESIYLDPPALPVEFTYGCCLESPSAQLQAQV